MKAGIACFYISWIKRNAPPRVPPRVKIRGTKEYAGVVELADTYDLGSYVVRHAGSSPVARTISSVHNGFELWTLDFFVISSFFVMY